MGESFLCLKAVPLSFVLAEKVREGITENVTHVKVIEIVPDLFHLLPICPTHGVVQDQYPKVLKSTSENIFNDC